jgi:hypothetical protein
MFLFDSSGNLTSQRDISQDISYGLFMYYSIAASNDGGVMVTQLYQSKILVYHSPPVQIDLFSKGVTSIGGISGSYLQQGSGEQTVIDLVSFTAKPYDGQVMLQWETAAEIDTAGFNIYRAESENSAYSKINNALIPAKGSSTQGTSYKFTDSTVKNRKRYYYKLEDVNINGKTAMHGPVRVTPRKIFALLKWIF